MIKVPIHLNFDMDQPPIGWVEIENEYAEMLNKMALSPSYFDKKDAPIEVISFGLIRASKYITARKHKKKDLPHSCNC